MVKIPVTSDPANTFTMPLGGVQYKFFTKFNERSQVFTMDITDVETDTLLVSGMPLILGSDILATFCPRIGKIFLIDKEAEVGYGKNPLPDDLGKRVEVIWLSNQEVVV